MVVAPSARHRQTEKSSRERVDSIVEFIGCCFGRITVLVVLRPQTKEPQRDEVIVGVLGFRADQITRDLHADKLVVGHVPVKSRNDPVAITESVRVRPHRESMRLIFGVPRNIEPVPPPTLAVMIRL